MKIINCVFRKTLIIVTATVLLLTGCSTQPNIKAVTATSAEPTILPEQLPETTSEDLGVYIFGQGLCDYSGNDVADYTLDMNGNIIGTDGKIVIAIDHTEKFSVLSTADVLDETALQQKIPAKILPTGQTATQPVEFDITFIVNIDGAVNPTVTISTSDSAVEIPYEANKALIAEEIAVPEDGSLSEITVTPKGNKVAVRLIGSFAGTYDILVKNLFGEEILRKSIVLTPEISEVGEKNHTCTFRETSVEPTMRSSGFTLHTCTECGMRYRDNYAEKLDCEHIYVDKVVPPTYSATGYTMHTCSVCGYTYNDNTTPILICTEHAFRETVVAPTSATGGYTLHACVNCGYSYTDNATQPIGGSGCTHSSAVPTHYDASCIQAGYTVYTCSICGYWWVEDYIDALGHSYDSGVITKQPTCSGDGVKTYTCARCGTTRTESISASGMSHNYEVIASQGSTCEAPGYKDYCCTNCGKTYRETVNELGHIPGETRYVTVCVGEEMHAICHQCGLDCTAAGVDPNYHIGKSDTCSSWGSKMVQTAWQDWASIRCTRCGQVISEWIVRDTYS